MKKFYSFFSKLFTTPGNHDIVESADRNFFDFSSSEKIKILRAAGRDAQKEQLKLLRAYESRFGQAG